MSKDSEDSLVQGSDPIQPLKELALGIFSVDGRIKNTQRQQVNPLLGFVFVLAVLAGVLLPIAADSSEHQSSEVRCGASVTSLILLSTCIERAQQGDVEAQESVAGYYLFKDSDTARHWYEQAAAQGSQRAYEGLQTLDQLRVDRICGATQAGVDLAECTARAQAGDSRAQFRLAEHFRLRQPDPLMAKQWLRRAAESGSEIAVASLCGAYGREKIDLPGCTARAQAGDPKAQFQLAEYYRREDPALAEMWLRRAADGGYKYAKDQLSMQRGAASSGRMENFLLACAFAFLALPVWRVFIVSYSSAVRRVTILLMVPIALQVLVVYAFMARGGWGALKHPALAPFVEKIFVSPSTFMFGYGLFLLLSLVFYLYELRRGTVARIWTVGTLIIAGLFPLAGYIFALALSGLGGQGAGH